MNSSAFSGVMRSRTWQQEGNLVFESALEESAVVTWSPVYTNRPHCWSGCDVIGVLNVK